MKVGDTSLKLIPQFTLRKCRYSPALVCTLTSAFIPGPLTNYEIMPVVIGKKFDVEVEMSTVQELKDTKAYRIRAYAYHGDNIFENFDCKRQENTYFAPDVLECGFTDGPPTAVRPGKTGSKLVWENVCVIADELSPDTRAGDKYAVCFCDGHGLGCDTAENFQTLVQAWSLSGGANIFCTETTCGRHVLDQSRDGFPPPAGWRLEQMTKSPLCFCCLILSGSTGPKPLENEIQPRYRAGSYFSLDISGVGITKDPVVTFCPAYDPTTSKRFTCRSPQKSISGKFVGTVSEDGRTATFANVYIPFTIPQGLLCWCPGGSCSTAADYGVQIGRYSVAGTKLIPQLVSSFERNLVSTTCNRNLRKLHCVRSHLHYAAHCGGQLLHRPVDWANSAPE